MATFEEGDLVLCTVDRIVGTIVFVKIEGNGEGSIVTSEIAPGRIRNIRDYVVPKKRIVCKVLRVSGDRIDLSLRRVNQKEQKEVLESYQQEQSCKSILKTVLGKDSDEAIEKICCTGNVSEFFEDSKKDQKELEKIVGKQSAEKIISILNIQKKKSYEIKKEISLSSTKSNGVQLIKTLLGDLKDIEVKYISAGRYSLIKRSLDPKKAESSLRETLAELEKKAKSLGLEFSIREK